MILTLEERVVLFWSHVDRSDADACWLYPLRPMANGYVLLTVMGKNKLAHRFAYEVAVGPIADGLQIDHLCRNRACVNPAHLEAVTQRENLRRGAGWAGSNARKTHCKRGHEFTPENTRLRPLGRNCRACDREREKNRVRRPKVVMP